MRLGVMAKTFEGTEPGAVLRACKEAGYESVQYNWTCSGLVAHPTEITSAVAEEVRAASHETGVAIDAVSATYNMIHPDLAEREKGRRGVAAIAAAARIIGTRVLTVCTGTFDMHDMWRIHPDNGSPEAWIEMCAEFRILLRIAEANDVVFGVEPELANVINSAKQARRLLDTFGNERIKIVFDAANLFEIADVETQRRVMDEAVDLLGDSIAIAHAKDRTADGRFETAGKGVLDYPYYVKALRRGGFEGSLITHGLRADEAPGVARFLKELI